MSHNWILSNFQCLILVVHFPRYFYISTTCVRQSAKPLKKISQTDAIFENVFRENQLSDDNQRSLRVSIDSKAKVKIGNLSRGGKARTLEAKEADDHDTEWQATLVPFGILNTGNDLR